MGHHEDGDVEGADDVGQLAARGRVEVRGRLVEHEDLRVHGEHRRDGDPSPLAEGQVVRRPVGELGHAHLCQGLEHPGVELVAAQPEVARPERHVVADRRHEQLVVGVLEDDADAAPDLGEVVLGDGQAGHRDGAGPGGQDAVEVQHERGLAGAVRAQHGDPFAAVHVEVHAEERLVPVGVGERQAAHVENGGTHGATSAVRLTSAHARGSTPPSAHCVPVAVRVGALACGRCSPVTAWPGGPAPHARRTG